jgi:hypothetical protein
MGYNLVIVGYFTNKKPRLAMNRGLKREATSYSPTVAVPSAQAGLTSLFGMGRGGAPPL